MATNKKPIHNPNRSGSWGGKARPLLGRRRAERPHVPPPRARPCPPPPARGPAGVESAGPAAVLNIPAGRALKAAARRLCGDSGPARRKFRSPRHWVGGCGGGLGGAGRGGRAASVRAWGGRGDVLEAAGTKSACQAAVDIQGPRGLEAAARCGRTAAT